MNVVEQLLHHLGMHGPEAAVALSAILVAAAFAGDWMGALISPRLRRHPGGRPERPGRSTPRQINPDPDRDAG